LPIENYVLDYFVIGVIPSQTLRVSSGLQLRTASEHFFFCHSEGSASDRRISTGDPSATPQGDK